MIYRQANPTDFERLAEMRWNFRTELAADPLTREKFNEFMPVMLDFLEESYNSRRWMIWVAEQDGMIVSHVYVEIIRKVPRPNRLQARFGYLTNMYTIPEMRGKGIGAELLREAVDWARREELEMVILWPAQGRQGFYARGGFIPEKEALVVNLE